MIKLILFNILMVEFLNTKYLFRIVFDTSRIPFSFDLKLGLLYRVLPWFNVRTEKEIGGKPHKIIDIICPILFDFNLCIEQNK